MSPDLFMRLASDHEFCAAVDCAPEHSLAQAGSPLQQRLLRLAVQRLRAQALPQRCYIWWGPRAPVDVLGCSA